METLDLRKELKQYYMPSAKKIELIEIPAFNFVMIDGAIEPDASPGTSPLFEQAVGAMYGAAYTLKFMFKKLPENPVDYPVMALEGLWFVEDGQFDIRKPGNWKYTLMILVPDLVGAEHFTEAVGQLRKKKPSPAVERLRLDASRRACACRPCISGLMLTSLLRSPAWRLLQRRTATR
jgi:hypothetical protein